MLETIILKNRPNLAQSSVKTYMCSLRRIMKDTGLELKSPEDFVKNVDIILEKAKKYSAIVRKSRLASILVLLDDKDDIDDKGDYSSKDKNDTIKRIRVVMMKDSKTVDQEETKQELSEKQKENFLPQDEILNIYEVLKEQATPLFKLNQLNKKQFEMMQIYVLLSLYLLIPPRRTMDYTHFKIRNINPETDNFFLVPKKKKELGSFIFNQYKNSNKLGAQVIERIPKELEKIIEKWKQFNKSDYLLVNNVGKQVAGSRITIMLNDLFGKKISTSMLRHIYLTNKFGNINLKELKDTAENMGSSGIERMLKYVDKNDDA